MSILYTLSSELLVVVFYYINQTISIHVNAPIKKKIVYPNKIPSQKNTDTIFDEAHKTKCIKTLYKTDTIRPARLWHKTLESGQSSDLPLKTLFLQLFVLANCIQITSCKMLLRSKRCQIANRPQV